MKYFHIHPHTVEAFAGIAASNLDADGRVIPTIGYLIGFLDGEFFYSHDFLIPLQSVENNCVRETSKHELFKPYLS